MTDNKALTSIPQTKHIPPSLWNFFDQTLQLNFVLVQIPAVETPAADYLLRLKITPKDGIHLKLTDFLPVFRVEIDIASNPPKQEQDETDYYPFGDADENIRK